MAQHSRVPYIPGDIMRGVFQFLPSKDRANVMRVNREWRAAASHEDLWDDKTVTVSKPVTLLPTYAKKLTLKGCGVTVFLNVLSHRNTNPLPDLHTLTATGRGMTLTAILHLTRMPNLRSLNISVDTRASHWGSCEPHILAIAALTNLTQLVLTGRRVGGGALAPLSCLSKLQDLSVGHCRLADIDIPYIARLTGLKHLDLSFNTYITNAGINSLTVLTGLQELNASFCKLNAESGPILAKWKQLRSLDVSWTTLGVNGLRSVGELTLLTSLAFRDTFGVLVSNPSTVKIECLTKLTKLKVLDFAGLNVPDAELLGSFQELEDLNIQGTKLSASAGAVIGQLTNLIHLDISKSRLPANGMLHVNHLSKLQALRASHISLTGTELDLSNLTDLQYLDLSDTIVGPAGAAALSPLTTLKCLYLRNARLGAAGVQHLSTLTQLLVLDLAGNNIGRQAVAHLSTLVSLTSLTMPGCKLGGQHNSSHELHLSALSTLTNLEDLDVTDNRLHPTAVPQLGRLSSLKSLKLGANNLGGALSPVDFRTLSALSSLSNLDLTSNNLCSTAGSQLASLTSLVTLDVSKNKLRTPALAAMTTMTKLATLRICDNHLDDSVAQVLPRFPELRRAYMGGNDIADPYTVSEEVEEQHEFLRVVYGNPHNWWPEPQLLSDDSDGEDGMEEWEEYDDADGWVGAEDEDEDVDDDDDLDF